VPSLDVRVEVLEQPDAAVAACLGLRAVAGKLDEVEPVRDVQRAREIGQEDDARLQRPDEDGLEALVVARDLPAQLGDSDLDLLRAEVDLADSVVELQDARPRP
jgi:hypothetical protein